MTFAEETYDLSLLETNSRRWANSPGLRLIYRDIFEELGTFLLEGESLEVGSGIGSMKETLRDVVTSDIEKTRYVDEGISCYAVGEGGRQWANILAVDVLHHLRFPMHFFESAAAALIPGGRLILNEPAATVGGQVFYRTFHHEPCDPSVLQPPFELPPDDEEGTFGNMGMGVALFLNHREWLTDELERLGLRLVNLRFRDLFAYPASGGFSKPSFLPASVLNMLLYAEKHIPQGLMAKVALRMTIVLERRAS